MNTETQDQPVVLEDYLDRLAAFEPTTLPVLSLYLNTQADEHGRTPDLVPFLKREFSRLANTWPATSPERASFDGDAQKVLDFVEQQLDPAVNGLALFACSGADNFFEAIQLNAPIDEHRVYAYNQPHLFHLARLDDEYPRYAAVVTDANTARIVVFGTGQMLEAEKVKGKKMNRVKVGGWSQARYQRRVENAQHQHAREVVEQLARIVRQDQVTHIVLAGDPMMIPQIEQELPKELADMLTGSVKTGVKTSEAELFEATLEKMREADAASDAEKVQRLLDRYRARGLAVVGPQDTLEALANGQVDEILISAAMEASRPETEEVEAILAPELPDSTGGTESEEPRPASMPDLLVTKAKQTGATVTFIEDASLLESGEGVGAFLRWRA